MKIPKRSKNLGKKRSRAELRAIELAEGDFSWIKPLAHKIRDNADTLGIYLAEVIARVALDTTSHPFLIRTRWRLTRNLAKALLPNLDEVFSNVEQTVEEIQSMLAHYSQDLLKNREITSELISRAISECAQMIENNPKWVLILGKPDILAEILPGIGENLSSLLSFIPALSARAHESLPDLREIFFKALFELPQDDRHKLYRLAEDILAEVYREHVFPRLEEMLSEDPRGHVLAPILKGAVEAIPGESCLNAALSMACTPRTSLTIGRVIAIAIQEMGGIYVKISQVIAELCPPSLARELRTNQDDAGGLSPSEERSWNIMLAALETPELQEWKPYFAIPDTPQRHFASASVGALYELQLTAEGRERFNAPTILIKLQRPNLHELFRQQSNHLLNLCDGAQRILTNNTNLQTDVREELRGIVEAIRRAVLNYYRQSTTELDFRQEKVNADRVKEALKSNESIAIPHFFMAAETVVLVERMPGSKVTKIVQAKYLARREIADTIVSAYFDLLFERGAVWADPHPGNILYDDVTNKVSMIDLNPCFVWDQTTRHNFRQLLYRLLLRDAEGVYETLFELVDERAALSPPKVLNDLSKFLNTPLTANSLMRFFGEFIKTLNENRVDLRVEVQAALRGLSQVALTATAVSARNSFGTLLRRHFGVREIVSAAWEVGLLRVFQTLTGVLFELARRRPEEDVGPVLDERDLIGLKNRVRELARAGVCNIEIVRISPEDHLNLAMASDGSKMLITSDLHIEIIEKRRPATVKYVVDIPAREWLRERQEFVKLASVARNFCIIECLEQLRRNSLDDYWRIVEAWSKPYNVRTVTETRLIGEVRVAGRKLFALRFAEIWSNNYAGVPKNAKRFWRNLVQLECRREEIEQNYIASLKQNFGNVVFTNVAFSTIYRIRMLGIEAWLWLLRRQIKANRFAMHLLPMTTKALEDLTLFGLSRNYSPRSR